MVRASLMLPSRRPPLTPDVEGPTFVRPLLELDILERLVSFLLPSLSSKTALTILKCLNAIAENLPPSSPGQWSQKAQLSELLYSKRYVSCFENVIGKTDSNIASQQACDAILALLCKTVSHDYQKRALVDAGILSLLSSRLASFVVREGLVPPGSEATEDEDARLTLLPRPAPSIAHLSPVLE